MHELLTNQKASPPLVELTSTIGRAGFDTPCVHRDSISRYTNNPPWLVRRDGNWVPAWPWASWTKKTRRGFHRITGSGHGLFVTRQRHMHWPMHKSEWGQLCGGRLCVSHYRLDSGSEVGFFFLDHQFEQISHWASILSDLDLGIWIHDGKTYQRKRMSKTKRTSQQGLPAYTCHLLL